MPVAVGMRGESSLTVDQSHSAATLGCGNLPTLGEAALVALMERAAVNAVRRGLAAGEETIARSINLRHLAPTPLGKRVRAEAVVTAITGNMITLSIRASDAVADVGECVHERQVVDREEFIWTAAARGAGR